MRASMWALAVVGLAAGSVRAEPTEPGQLTNKMQAAKECIKCHSFANSPEMMDEPFVTPTAWQATMMGNSARDPVFWAGVAVASQDEPGGTTDCVRCHVPRAFVEGRGEAVGIDELVTEDLSGVDCELCHRLLDDGVTPPGNARYVIDDMLAPDGDIRKRGPWDYEMGLVPMHAWQQDPYMGDSRLCGTCHDVTTSRMRVDARGQSLGVLFGEQRTYSEWKNSAFAVDGDNFKSCQDCHMPAVNDVGGCAEFVAMGDVHATGGRRHDLAGANRRVVEILKGVYGDAGTDEVGDAFFDLALASIDRTLAEAATLEVTAPNEVDLAAGISGWDVKVTNETGHKLPSGYSEGRVMWLEVVGRYAGEVVYSSGRWVDGALEGDPQQRTYEAIAVEQATNKRFHLLLDDTWVVDSRIPPAGLKADLETDPVGDRYALLPDQTWPNFDEVSYTFAPAAVVDATPEDATDDVMDLSVRLLYVVNTPEYVEFLADENVTNAAGQEVVDLFAGLASNDPLVLAEWAQSVPLTGLMTSTPGTTSGGSSGEGGSTSGTAPTTSEAVPTTSGTAGASSEGGSDSMQDEPKNDAGGCSCDSSGPGWIGALGVLGLRRRRTRGRCDGSSRGGSADRTAAPGGSCQSSRQ